MTEHDIDIARAILIVGEQLSDALFAVVNALAALVPPKPPTPDRLICTLITHKGERRPMLRRVEAPMSVNVGTTGTTVVVETAKGVIVPTVGPIVYASDNPAVATYAADGTWAAIAPGVANMSQLDQTNGLTDTTQLTVTVAPPPVADALVGTLVPKVGP
jgi:hypothetical protein